MHSKNTYKATMAELCSAIPYILDAPKDTAPIDILCHRADFGMRAYPNEITVSPEGGIDGERWMKHPWLRLEDGSPDPRIQVSILPRRVFDIAVGGLEAKGGNLHPGDTIIADIDTSEANMPIGQRLTIGTSVIEVTDYFNDGCVKWKVRNGAAAKAWIVEPDHIKYRLRGVLCKVVQAGVIAKTDLIRKTD